MTILNVPHHEVGSRKYSRLEVKSKRICPCYLNPTLVICLLFIVLLVICSFVTLFSDGTSWIIIPNLLIVNKTTLETSIFSWSLRQDNVVRRKEPTDKVISCYYNTPMRQGSSQLLPSGINPRLCTHINVAFARIVDKQVQVDDDQVSAIRELIKLKSINSDLKILLSIGGAGGDHGFSDMVVDHASRKTFIRSVKYLLRNLTLDGIDLDWEFPAVHDEELKKKSKHGRERQHFSQLLREIRMEYNRERRNYLLTIAAAAPQTIIDAAYDVDQLNEYTDFVNIMTYDFHFFSKVTPFTGLNAPLYPRDIERLFLSTLNINYTIHTYIRKGLDRNKIVVGIPTYGHSFHLVNPDNPTIGSPASGYGLLGNLGFVNYPEICRFIEHFNSNVTIKQNNDAKVPYFYMGNEWVSYDTPDSVMEKAKYIKDNNLRGAMIYCLNSDDYEGVCVQGGNEKFPLSHSVKNALINTDSSEIYENRWKN